MVSKTARRGASKRRDGTQLGSGAAQEKRVALTLKVDSGLYVRLSTFRATQRKKTQDILEQALLEYLDRAGA
jgi:hypothetical protein